MNRMNERKRNRGQGGFTLIELLVVIAILAVLGGVAVFAVGNLTEGADDGACEVEKTSIRTAAQASVAKTGDDAGWESYMDFDSSGAPKYWTYTPTAAVGPTTADPVGAGSNADGDCDSETP